MPEAAVPRARILFQRRRRLLLTEENRGASNPGECGGGECAHLRHVQERTVAECESRDKERHGEADPAQPARPKKLSPVQPSGGCRTQLCRQPSKSGYACRFADEQSH